MSTGKMPTTEREAPVVNVGDLLRFRPSERLQYPELKSVETTVGCNFNTASREIFAPKLSTTGPVEKTPHWFTTTHIFELKRWLYSLYNNRLRSSPYIVSQSRICLKHVHHSSWGRPTRFRPLLSPQLTVGVYIVNSPLPGAKGSVAKEKISDFTSEMLFNKCRYKARLVKG